MATIKKLKKAQTGDKVPKGMVESEMFPGKMIPKSKSNYANGEYAKMVQAGKKAPAPKAKAPAKKPIMKEGGKVAKSPAQKKFAALAAPKDKITFADKIAGSKKKK